MYLVVSALCLVRPLPQLFVTLLQAVNLFLDVGHALCKVCLLFGTRRAGSVLQLQIFLRQTGYLLVVLLNLCFLGLGGFAFRGGFYDLWWCRFRAIQHSLCAFVIFSHVALNSLLAVLEVADLLLIYHSHIAVHILSGFFLNLTYLVVDSKDSG